jgi:hypothetical protein
MSLPAYLELLPSRTDAANDRLLQTLADCLGDEAFEALIERWRMRAFDAYCAIRKAQRENDGDASPRLVALCEAAEIAVTLAEEIGALRAAVVLDLPSEPPYAVTA